MKVIMILKSLNQGVRKFNIHSLKEHRIAFFCINEAKQTLES